MNNKKTLITPPLFYENGFVTDFKKKTELFSSFFTKQCTGINNGSSLPCELLRKKVMFVSNITFPSDDILKMNQNVDSEKTDGYASEC